MAPIISRVQMKQAARQGRANLVPSPSTQERAHRPHRPGCFSNPPGACTNSWEGLGPFNTGAGPGHRVYYRQSGPPQGTHTTGDPIPAPGHPSVRFPTLSALLPGYQSNHTLTRLSSRHEANSQELKTRVPRSPVLGPPVTSRSDGNFPYLISPNPGAMAQVSGTITNTLGFISTASETTGSAS